MGGRFFFRLFVILVDKIGFSIVNNFKKKNVTKKKKSSTYHFISSEAILKSNYHESVQFNLF